MSFASIDRRTLLALLGSATLPTSAAFAATDFPTRPIKIIVPFAPGGSGDISARLIGKKIEDRTRQPVVIDTRPGANGIIGTMAVKTADPDGYTVLLITTSTHAANPSLVRNLSYDPGKDFTVVGVFKSSGTYLLIQPQSPWNNLADFLAAAKTKPGELLFGYFNASSRTPAEYLAKLAKVEVRGVPYRAIGNAVTDLMAGQIHFLFMDTTASNQYLVNKQLRPIAITRPTRSAQAPEIAAVAETFPGFNITGFLGMAVPAATPRDIAQRLNDLVNEALAQSDVKARLDEFGLSSDPMTLEQCARETHEERERWVEYTRVAGIQPE